MQCLHMVSEHTWDTRVHPRAYPNLLIESQTAAVENEVAIVEATRGQPQTQEASVFPELHHAMLGVPHTAG